MRFKYWQESTGFDQIDCRVKTSIYPNRCHTQYTEWEKVKNRIDRLEGTDGLDWKKLSKKN
jgi:hypothetical protein